MARDSQNIAYRGNRRWSGNHGKVWLDGDLVFEIQAFELKVTADRDDVIIGNSKDSKIVSLTGEGTITIKNVFDRGFNNYLEELKAGHDPRFTIIASLEDPDAIGGQGTRLVADNCWLNELNLLHFTKGELVETEIPFGVTPEDITYLNTVEL